MPAIALPEQQLIVGKIHRVSQGVGLAVGTDQPYAVFGQSPVLATLIQQGTDLLGIVAFAVKQSDANLSFVYQSFNIAAYHVKVIASVIKKTYIYGINGRLISQRCQRYRCQGYAVIPAVFIEIHGL
jgi:hypothetical protein